MIEKIKWFAVWLLLVVGGIVWGLPAVAQSAMTSSGAGCYVSQYLDDRGIEKGETVTVAYDDTRIFDTAYNAGQSVVTTIDAGESLTVLSRPVCFYSPEYDNRQWQVETAAGERGYISEYDRHNGVLRIRIVPDDSPQELAISYFHMSHEQPRRGRLVEIGETVTLSWYATGVDAITLRQSADSNREVIVKEAASFGIVDYTVPMDIEASPLTFALDATAIQKNEDNNENSDETITASIEVLVLDADGDLLPQSESAFYPTDTPTPAPTAESAIAESYTVEVVYQPFENGWMLWNPQTEDVYVGYDFGFWGIQADTWDGDPIDLIDTPPDGRFHPREHLGAVWVADDARRQLLGWATEPASTHTVTWRRYGDYKIDVVMPDMPTLRLFFDNAWELVESSSD